MSTNLAIFVSLLSTSILCFFSNSWLMLWILLEINTLSFCSITTKITTGNTKGEKESFMKYLIIQSVASIMLVLSSLMTKSTQSKLTLMSFLMVTSLILKSAGAPLFQWFISVAKKMTWLNFMILLTWQKLAPVYLLIFQKKPAIFISMFASMLMGTILMVNKTQIKEILAYSSLFNLSWMTISVMVSIKTFLTFVFVYWSILVFSIKPFKTSDSKEINSMKTASIPKQILFLIMIMLAGIPPLLGFTIKWMIIMKMLYLTMSYLIVILLTFSAINLFVYFRLINFTTMVYSKNHNKNLKKSLFFFNTTFIFTNIISFFIIIF